MGFVVPPNTHSTMDFHEIYTEVIATFDFTVLEHFNSIKISFSSLGARGLVSSLLLQYVFYFLSISFAH